MCTYIQIHACVLRSIHVSSTQAYKMKDMKCNSEGGRRRGVRGGQDGTQVEVAGREGEGV